jgi:hypothetical protein
MYTLLHHPIENLRSESKCNTIPDKEHNLPNNKIKNNTIINLLTYSMSPTTEYWLRGTTKKEYTYLCPLITHKWTTSTQM